MIGGGEDGEIYRPHDDILFNGFPSLLIGAHSR